MDKVTAAHIHSGKAGENGKVVVVLFKSDNATGPINGTFAQENFTAADLQGPMQGKSISDLVRAMQNGETYTNVHRSIPGWGNQRTDFGHNDNEYNNNNEYYNNNYNKVR